MKVLYIIRHASSNPAQLNESDIERTLNGTGKSQALLMAQKVFTNNIRIDSFICSPALRTRQTCEIFCELYHYPLDEIILEEKLYHPNYYSIQNVISEVDNKHDSIAIFTHNPGITDLVNQLDLNVRIDNVPSCGIFCVSSKTNDWRTFLEAEKNYVFFDYPNNPQSNFSK